MKYCFDNKDKVVMAVAIDLIAAKLGCGICDAKNGKDWVDKFFHIFPRIEWADGKVGGWRSKAEEVIDSLDRLLEVLDEVIVIGEYTVEFLSMNEIMVGCTKVTRNQIEKILEKMNTMKQ